MRSLLPRLAGLLLAGAVFVPAAAAQAPIPPTSPVTQPVQQPARPVPSGVRLPAPMLPTDTGAPTTRPRNRDSILVDSINAAMKDDVTRAALLSVMRSRVTSQAEIDAGNTVFGVDVFRRETSLFDPNNVGPVPPDYRVGPGDQLALVLTGDIEEVHELPVSREGSIVIPNVGTLRVANLTMEQLNDLLFQRLSRVYSGMSRGPGGTSHFQVTVTNLGTNQVSVLGDVQTPGAYKISKLGTVLTALYSAGGPTDNGSLRQVRVVRGGTPVATIDLYDYLISGSTATSARLESGDVVLVPPHGPRVRLAGPVVRPATYELIPGENLGDLIRMAGGFRPEAEQRRVQIERIVPPARRTAAGSDRELFDVTAAALTSSREPLLAGDVVHVLTIAGHVANRVNVSGNVWTPGPIALQPGMKLSDAIARAGGVRQDTYDDALQVTRLQPDFSHRVFRVRVPGRTPSADAPTDALGEDITLQPDDEIRVFSLSEYRQERYVNVGGAVKKPGHVPYVPGMTMRDLLMQAGGLDEGALLSEAEVARMPEDRSGGTTATTVRVALDSTYLFDRKPGVPYVASPGLPAPANRAPEIPLRPYDDVLILKQPDWALPRTVTITGEVRYPGQYALRNKNERLADLISRAGGLTPDGYPEGIVFMRDTLGRIGVDLPAVLRNPSSADNLLLRDGDKIDIPVHSAIVRVTGSVNSPINVPFVRGANIDYYVLAAGGATEKGNAKHAFVTQPNGKVEARQTRFFVTSSPTPLPGSIISVPDKAEGQHFDPVALLTTATTIMTSLLAAVAILKR